MAANPPREFEEPEDFPDVSREFVEGLMKKWYNSGNIRLLIKHFSLFNDIKLDEKRKEKVYMLSDQMEQWLGNEEISGFSATSSCLNSLNAISETASAMKGFDLENFKKYSNVIEDDTIVSADTLSPIASISAIAIAHFGFHSNFYGTTLFDRNLPSKDINLTLRNRAELLSIKEKKEQCVFIYEKGLPKLLIKICGEYESLGSDD
jgi:hypothetical protein